MVKFLLGVAVGIAATLVYVSYRQESEWADEKMDEELKDIERSIEDVKNGVYADEEAEESPLPADLPEDHPFRSTEGVRPTLNRAQRRALERRIPNPKEERKGPMVAISEPASPMQVPRVEGGREDEERAYVITQAEFEEPYEQFDKFEVEYDITNDLLMDEIGGPVEPEILASKSIIDQFYEDDDSDTVYVRNNGLTIDYQITKVDGFGNRVKKRPRRVPEDYDA